MPLVWITVCAMLAGSLESAVGTHALAVPVLAAVAFYLAAVFGWRLALLPIGLAATALDVFAGHPGPLAVVALLPVLAWALLWRRHGECRQLLLQALPGAVAGLLYAGAVAAGEAAAAPTWLAAAYRPLVGYLLAAGAAGAVALPAVCRGLDGVAHHLQLPRYLEIRRYGPGSRHVH